MGTIIIPDLSATASARRGSAYQVAALARHSQRAEVDRWQPLRDPWVHAFISGIPRPLGRAPPRLAQLAEAIASHIQPERICDAVARMMVDPNTRDLLLGTRAGSTLYGARSATSAPIALGPEDWISAVREAGERAGLGDRLDELLANTRRCLAQITGAGGGVIRPRPAPPRPVPPAERPPPPEEVVVQNTGGVLSAVLSRAAVNAAASVGRRTTQASVQRPIWLTAIAWTFTPSFSESVALQVRVPEIGFALYVLTSDSSNAQGYGALALDMLARDGASLELEWEGNNVPLGNNQQFGLSAQLSYRHVSGIRPRAPIEPLETPYEGRVSPYLQLDPSMAAVFDAAGIPDEWYIVRPDAPLPLP